MCRSRPQVNTNLGVAGDGFARRFATAMSRFFPSCNMTESFSKSAASRNFAQKHIDQLSDQEVHDLCALARWKDPDKQICPMCGSVRRHYFFRQRQQWRCNDCSSWFSVTSGTALSDRKLPLRTLLAILIKFNADAKGMAFAEAARQVGVTPKTAQALSGKLRELLIKNADAAPLSGLVEMDGGYFCGKPRKENRRAATNQQIIDLTRRAQALANGKRLPPMGTTKANQRRYRNRRVVLVMREVAEKGNGGATRTKAFVIPKETAEYVVPLVHKHVVPGSRIWTDESAAYSSLSDRYEHKAVVHSREFSSVDGVNENQAESFFARLRRFEVGTAHRMTPKYLMDKAVEMCWREDNRNVDARTRLMSLLTMLLNGPLSEWWRGYWQNNHRAGELIYR